MCHPQVGIPGTVPKFSSPREQFIRYLLPSVEKCNLCFIIFFYPIISSFLIFKVSAYGESHQSLSAFPGYGRVWIGFCNKLITNVILSSVR